MRKRWLVLVTAALILVGSSSAFAHDHDPQRSGHPLRVTAYLLHPIGVVLDRLVFHPAHWIVSHEPFETLFGHRDY